MGLSDTGEIARLPKPEKDGRRSVSIFSQIFFRLLSLPFHVPIGFLRTKSLHFYDTIN